MSPAIQTRERQDDWSIGEVYDVAPQLISPNGAARMANVLLDEDGNPYRRGGSAYLTKTWEGKHGIRFIWDGQLLPGARTIVGMASPSSPVNPLAVIGADGESLAELGGLQHVNKSLQWGMLADVLYLSGGVLYGGSRKSALYSTGTISLTNGSKTVTGSGTTWNTLVDAGMLLHRTEGEERAYVVASIDSTTQLTLRDPYEGETGGGLLYTLNPTWSVVNALGTYVDIYQYVTTCANRLVLAKNREIVFSEVGNPHKYTNHLGTRNSHTIPQGTSIVALETIGDTVLVFTTAGVWALDGLALDITDLNGNPQHRIRQVSGEIIVAGAAGIAGWEQRLVVPTGDGIYLMDGISETVKISKLIERLYLAYLHEGCRPGGAVVYRGHYFLPIISPPAEPGIGETTESVKTVLVCRLDRPSRDRGQVVYPWSHLTGDGGEIFAYALRTSVEQLHPKLLGGQGRSPSRLLDCSGYFEPSGAIKNDADGSSFQLDIVTRDYETGAGTTNVVRAVRPRYELVDAASDDPKLQVSYSDAAAVAEGEGTFTLAGEVGASDGRTPEKVRINKRARYIRIRITSVGAAARCVLRSLELITRPSEAVRR